MMPPQNAHITILTTRLACIRTAMSLALSLAAGCTTVKPWQRETLSDSIMQPGRNPIAAAQLDHIYFSREAASGGTSVGGGGCGCN